MSDWNGKPQQPQPMTKPDDWSEPASLLRTLPLALPRSVRLALLLTLLGLVLLLVACATPSGAPTASAKNPQPPQLREPLPQDSYSKRAAESIKSWADSLTGM